MVVDVVDRANIKTCVTLLRYSVDKTEISQTQVGLFARKKGDKETEQFQQVVYVKYKLEEIVYLLDVRISVYDQKSANEPFCNVL